MLNKPTPKRRYWKKSIHYVLAKKIKPQPIIAPLHFVEKKLSCICVNIGGKSNLFLSPLYI